VLDSNYRTTPEKARKEMFTLLLNVMDLAIESCKSVQLRSDLGTVENRLRRAKHLYARAVAHSSYYRMNALDVAQLELRSARLEREIARLEKRLRDKRVQPILSSDAESHL
jgi:uncharacterized small protein (DUF1192 family)